MTKAVKEREELEKLQREQRTRKSELSSLKNKLQNADFAVEKAQEAETRLSERKHQMDQKLKATSSELAKVKNEFNAAQAENTRFKSVSFQLHAFCY